MLKILQNAQRKLLQQNEQPWHVIATKGARYVMEVASAPLHLRAIDEVGAGARTRDTPVIDNQGFIRLGHHVIIHSFNTPVQLRTAPKARLTIGDKVFLNYGVNIDAHTHIELGSRVLVGPYVSICDGADPEAAHQQGLTQHAPIIIEDDVWLGAKCTIMPGVRIGRGAIVGVSAIVRADVPPFAVVGGQPAKIIKMLDPSKFVPSA